MKPFICNIKLDLEEGESEGYCYPDPAKLKIATCNQAIDFYILWNKNVSKLETARLSWFNGTTK